MPASLDHIGVVVGDLDRALGFWHDLLGLPVTGRGTADWPHLSELNGLPGVALRWCTLALGGTVVELTAYEGGPRPAPRASGEDEAGRAHVGIVVDDLDAITARLRRAGIRLRSDGPVTIGAGQYAGWRALYALDPDGTSVEFFEMNDAPGDRGERSRR
jgi:catechol 2,3-dioxygenase-like lactoylglutathione lyase family enzyme